MDATSPQPNTTPADIADDDLPDDSPGVDTDGSLTRPRRARKKVNLLAPLALILGIALSPLALIFGHIAIGQIRRADQRGAAMAWLAIGLGWLWLVGLVVIIGAVVSIWAENPFWP